MDSSKTTEPTAAPNPRGDLGQRLQAIFEALETGIYERGQALRLAILAAIAGESLFLLGPPGVAKSLIARRLQNAFAGAECFDYLMGRFSTPEEIFGPVSINRLKNEDLYVRRTEHYLPHADIVFLDEIWKASPPIQNALLTALNEKVFRNGNEEIRLPLKLLVAASNETAPDESSQAFWDRFLVRLELQSLKDGANFLSMLADLSDPYRDVVPAAIKIDRATWDFWRDSIGFVELGPAALDVIAALRLDLQALHAQGQGPAVSDRRWKKCGGLLRAAAFCNERAQVEAIDCLILADCLWNNPEEQTLVRQRVELAVRDQAWASRSQTPALRQRLADLKEALRSASGYDEETLVREPMLADGEYYLLQGLPPGLAIPQGVAPQGLEARIWRTDFETLPADTTGLATDIFLYQAGQYLSSSEIICQRGADWSVVAAGTNFALACTENRRKNRVHRPLGETEWAVWDQGIAALMADCAAEASRAQAEIAQTIALAERHFFVHASAAELLTHGLGVYLQELADLQNQAQGCQDQHGSC